MMRPLLAAALLVCLAEARPQRWPLTPRAADRVLLEWNGLVQLGRATVTLLEPEQLGRRSGRTKV